MEPPLREMFFSVAKFLAHTRNKLNQVKTFVQCSLLETLPWNANVVGMSHEHWPHAIFTRFQKNKLGYFWPRLPTVKVIDFLLFRPRIHMVKALFQLGHFWPRIPMVKLLLGLGHFWPRLLTVKDLFFMDIFIQGYFYWPLRLWISMMKVMFVIWDFEQPLESCSVKRKFAFAGGNLWKPTVQAGVRALGATAGMGLQVRVFLYTGRQALAWK